MHFSLSLSHLLLLAPLALASPVSEPVHTLAERAVSCTAVGTGSSCTTSLTRYGCATTNTNQCSAVGTVAPGSQVSIGCYVFGETVNGYSMWYRLNPNGNGYMPAAFFSTSCSGIPPC
ncbi:hypothetical protein M501DRAFT_1017791 [Patellaria atrata CBS 101060]|uniref:SH3 domain-containing protein n=1 Tax=Patellaria atrata CBS 101060 TaxID=1346257 RepID=A0A9P4S8W2_9PEZI|nr:hypothetical protein M501DRAFT_1017791 [Patellaria atrata CBS 101060]